MKKIIKHPDGREETVEGTAEEIAEYERKLREGDRTKGKKPVLRGAEEHPFDRAVRLNEMYPKH